MFCACSFHWNLFCLNCIEPWPSPGKQVDVMAAMASTLFHKPNSRSIDSKTILPSTSILNARMPMDIESYDTTEVPDRSSQMNTTLCNEDSPTLSGINPNKNVCTNIKQGEKSTISHPSIPTPAQLYIKLPHEIPTKCD